MPASSRRLSAIVFTDLAGFTRLAQEDEDAALRLRAEHQGLVRSLLAPHGGREVKTLGDGFLLEFPSAVESLRCAIEIQRAVARRNAAPDVRHPIRLRIGIHLGDVIDDGADIVGDAVNVASRIEPLAEAGGICISGSVYELVRNKLPVEIEKLGPRQLKHVELPVEIYRVELSDRAPGSRPAVPEPTAELRLAVLPFANLSPDPLDEYFADGLTDELIAQTAKIPSVRVIARTSVLRYKGSTKSMREVGHDLGVRLALEGSVRKAGGRLRVMVQLVDTSSEAHLWSSRYDRSLDDIFAIQDDIAGQIALAISGQVAGRGSDRPSAAVLPSAGDTSDLEAYASFLHGRKLYVERSSETTMRQAMALFEEAVLRDPRFSRARVGLAGCLLWLAPEGAVPYDDALRRCRSELLTAIAQNDALAEAHSTLAGLLLVTDELVGAEEESRRALELNPSLADPYRWLAQLAGGTGDLDEAIRLLEAARRLDPVDINVTTFLGRCYFYAGRIDEALAFWARNESLAPYRTAAHRAEFYLSRDDLDHAQEMVRELERLRPDNAWTETYRAILATRRGRPEEARRAIERLERKEQGGEMTVLFASFIRFALGEREAFIAGMQRASELRVLPVLDLRYSPLYASVRGDPRIQALLDRQRALRAKRSAS